MMTSDQHLLDIDVASARREAIVAAAPNVSELLDFTAEPTVNPLRELMSAECMLLGAEHGQAYRTPHRRAHEVDSATIAARRLREKRRQKAKQAARRLKASRS